MIGIVIATPMEARPLLRALAARPIDQDVRTEGESGPGATHAHAACRGMGADSGGNDRAFTHATRREGMALFATYEFPAGPDRPGGRIIVSGMGPGLAAQATEQLLAAGPYDSVINAGVCGMLAGQTERGQVFRIARVFDGEALLAGGTPATGEAILCADGPWPHLPAADLATVPEPVFRDPHRRRLAEHARLVDMEGRAVAEICQRHGVPCHLIKGVTDYADSAGKGDGQRHLDNVSARVAMTVAAAILPPPSRRLTLKKLLNFTRIEHSLFSLPLLLAGAYLGAGMAAGVTGQMPSWRVLLLIVLAGTGARTLGMAANRILDRKLDARNARTANRELPAGRMSLAAAMGVGLGGLAVYLLACWLLGPLCLMLSAAPVVPLVMYPLLKRFTALCHFGIGLCLALAPLGAHVAAADSLALSPAVLALAVFTFCWMSGFDVLYAMADLDSDRRTGVHSIPAALGVRGAFVAAGATHLAALVAAAFLLVRLQGGWLSGLALAATASGLVYAYLPNVPLPRRFFPTSAVAAAAAAMIVLMESLP